MIETPSEIVLVGYENGTVKLLSDALPKNHINTSNGYAIHIYHNHTKNDPATMFCDLCDYQTKKRKLLIQHMTSNHFYPDQQCKICGKRLNKMQLRLHMRFHDLKFVCDYCGKRFGDSKALKNHKNSRVCGEKLQESLSLKKYKCDFCEYRTHTRKLLMIHFRTLHVPKDHRCPKCNKDMTLKQLNSHKNYCNQDYVYCDYCGKRFSNFKYLNAHCKSKHFKETIEIVEADEIVNAQQIKIESGLEETDESIYEFVPSKEQLVEKIDVKNIDTNLIESLTEEDETEKIEYTKIETIDEEVPNQITFAIDIDEPEQQVDEDTFAEYQCAMCSDNVMSLDELIEHMNRYHKECDSECPICHKMFAKQSLQRHLRYHDKKHICTKCGRGFSETGLLKAHMDRKFSCLGTTLEELQQDPNYMAKEFSCNICLYRGLTKSHLTRHIRNIHHIIAKEVQCPDCGKQLTRQQWQSHRRTHNKIKCHICNKWFSDSKFFKVHLENHSKPSMERRNTINLFNITKPKKGENYYCPKCDFQTKERRFLVQHLKVKHAPKDFECQFEECKGKMFTQTQLRLHQRFHKLSFKCEKCGTGFPDGRDLKRHVDGKKCFKTRKSRMKTNDNDKTTKNVISTKVQRKDKKTSNIQTEVVLIESENEVNQYKPTKLDDSNDIIQENSLNTTSEYINRLSSPIVPSEIEINPCQNVTPNVVGILECPNCNYETDDKNDLMEHWNQLHAPRDQPCPEPQCNGKLFSKAQLKLHMRFHSNKLNASNTPIRTTKKSHCLTDNVSMQCVLTKNLKVPNMAENSWIYRCSESYKNCYFMTKDKKEYDQHRARIHKCKSPDKTKDHVTEFL